MRKILLLLTLATLVAVPTLAKPKHIPNYTPMPLGAEWNYTSTTSAGTTMNIKQVVTKAAKRADGVWEYVVKNVSPQETLTDYEKRGGFVWAIKMAMPSMNHNSHWDGPKNVMLIHGGVGKSWEYKGKANNVDTHQTYKITGAEEVEVPAGKFRAIKVKSVTKTAGTTTEMTQWYVDGIGLVKSFNKGSNFSSTTELVSYKFPK